MRKTYERKIQIVEEEQIIQKILIDSKPIMSHTGFKRILAGEERRVLVAVNVKDVQDWDYDDPNLKGYVYSRDWRYATLEDVEAIMKEVKP